MLFLQAKRTVAAVMLLAALLLLNGCDRTGTDESTENTPENKKVGVLFLQVGTDETYSFNWIPQFMRNLWDFFPKGQFVGGPKEGGDCYTLIHFADEIEAEACGVAQGTPIDVFCNVYKNGAAFPVHSISDIGMTAFVRECGGEFGNFFTQFMFAGMHGTIDPNTNQKIAGPVVADPNGAGRGVEDFLEVAGFDWMRTIHSLPNQQDMQRRQLLKWWYGNDAPGYAPDSQELINIKDRLQELMPETEFVFRHGWEAYLANQDAYGNPTRIADSAETAIDELINQEKVGKIIVLHTYPAFANMTQYGHEWKDKNGKGVSAVAGKTFKECINDINDGFGPSTRSSRSTYLKNKPLEEHWEHPFPLIQSFVKKRNASIPVAFAPPYGEFEAFDNAVAEMIKHAVAKYRIPDNASLKVVLGHHGFYGGYEKAQDCDCYFKEAEALFARVSATVKEKIAWPGKFDIAHGAVEYAEGGMKDDDPPTPDKPFGAVMSVAEQIDRAINGLYVNSQGVLIDNGTDNYDYVILVPYFFESESADTLYGVREVLGNMIPPDPNGRVTEYYLRDTNDADGSGYDADDLDEENFTAKVYDASGWPSTPKGESRSYNKGSAARPTTVIVTGAILSVQDDAARQHLTDAAVEAIRSSLK